MKNLRTFLSGECIKNLRAHRSVPQSLAILHRTMFRLPVGAANRRVEVDWGALDNVHCVDDLMALLIDDMVAFQQKGYIVLGELANSQAPQLDAAVFEGHYQRHVCLERRLQFLSRTLELPAASLSVEHLDTLWKTFVLGAMTEKQVCVFVCLFLWVCILTVCVSGCMCECKRPSMVASLRACALKLQPLHCIRVP